MKKRLLILFWAILSFIALSAQECVNRSANLPRNGDFLMKQEVSYLAPGDSGRNIVWDFREPELINDNYKLDYFCFGDTIVGTERRTMYYYQLSGDTLCTVGYENPTTLMHYRRPEPFLVYPFCYGRTIFGYFDGMGKYCDRLSVHVQGATKVTADATGMILLPGGDTLRQVIRVHSLKKLVETKSPLSYGNWLEADSLPFPLNRDSVDYRLLNDSVHMELHTWRWYAEGYRYPVFETIRNVVCKTGGNSTDDFLVSFYYPPHEQYYALENDPENQTRRDQLESTEQSLQPAADGSSPVNRRQENIEYSYYLDLEGNLQLSYVLSENADIKFILFDFSGRQLSATRTLSYGAGSYRDVLSLKGYPVGEYLLHISVNNKIYGEKILTY